MKRIIVIGSTVAALAFMNVVHADFTFHSSTVDACERISGFWSGTAKVKNWLIGECVYNGSGVTSSVDSSGKFKLDVSADKNSGSFICPKHAETQLLANCNNGNVTITTDYGNLNGYFSENTGNAQGALTVSPGIKADISIQFQRVG